MISTKTKMSQPEIDFICTPPMRTDSLYSNNCKSYPSTIPSSHGTQELMDMLLAQSSSQILIEASKLDRILLNQDSSPSVMTKVDDSFSRKFIDFPINSLNSEKFDSQRESSADHQRILVDDCDKNSEIIPRDEDIEFDQGPKSEKSTSKTRLNRFQKDVNIGKKIHLRNYLNSCVDYIDRNNNNISEKNLHSERSYYKNRRRKSSVSTTENDLCSSSGS
ncbi:hypothetical protein QR98_0034480 [Sarcoptes scabiei]|uniref:Uncharacterized protein n=1 Tax=Sarcoptes scabiei TaxID=52283 RepID=A0A132A3N3_SARSC|nr:hypothetical protein QR98_0034480 [Sarcoptes scabiei]